MREYMNYIATFIASEESESSLGTLKSGLWSLIANGGKHAGVRGKRERDSSKRQKTL
jgi:hypothetical protein